MTQIFRFIKNGPTEKGHFTLVFLSARQVAFSKEQNSLDCILFLCCWFFFFFKFPVKKINKNMLGESRTLQSNREVKESLALSRHDCALTSTLWMVPVSERNRSRHEPPCQGFIPPDERGQFGVARHRPSSPFSDRDGCLSSPVMASVMNGLHCQGKKGKGGLGALRGSIRTHRRTCFAC